MFRARLSLVALAVVCLVPSVRLHAFDDWQPINPAELKMTEDPAHPGDAIMLYHEETADDMTRHRYVYKRVKVLTEKGKDRANVEIPYDATFVGVTDIRARTIAPDGTITPLAGKTFNTTLIKSHGVKYQAKTFTLPNVQVGSIIEWKYTEYWEDYLIAPRWVVQDELYQKHAKFTFVPMIKAGHYIQDSRGDIKDRVFHMLVGLPEKTEIKETVNNRLELELHDIPAFVDEEFAPPAAMMKMRVNFYYGSDKMGKPQEFWKQEGKYWNKEVEQFAGRSGAVAAAVGQVISPSDTNEQKARKIYAYVQKIRNLNYTREEGALEDLLTKESREKRTVDDVILKHEGYRDEIARLFWGMGRAAGLPVYLMRVSDRDEYFFQVTVPNPLQLTSEIAIVTVDGKEIFVDPGTPLCPFGLLAWQHTSTQGIRQAADGGTAVASAPGASYKDGISKRVGHLVLNEDGSAKGKIGIAWTGEEALVRRLVGLKTDAAGRKKDLEEELKAMLPPGAYVQMDKSSDWEDAEKQLTANFSVEIPSYASNTGKRMVVPTGLFESRNRQPFDHGDRKLPVYFKFPYYVMDEVQLTFPATLQMENFTEIQPIRTDYSLYKVLHSSTGNTVTISRDFAMAGIGFQQQEYPELRKFFSSVSAGDSQPLVLTTVK